MLKFNINDLYMNTVSDSRLKELINRVVLHLKNEKGVSDSLLSQPQAERICAKALSEVKKTLYFNKAPDYLALNSIEGLNKKSFNDEFFKAKIINKINHIQKKLMLDILAMQIMFKDKLYLIEIDSKEAINKEKSQENARIQNDTHIQQQQFQAKLRHMYAEYQKLVDLTRQIENLKKSIVAHEVIIIDSRHRAVNVIVTNLDNITFNNTSVFDEMSSEQKQNWVEDFVKIKEDTARQRAVLDYLIKNQQDEIANKLAEKKYSPTQGFTASRLKDNTKIRALKQKKASLEQIEVNKIAKIGKKHGCTKLSDPNSTDFNSCLNEVMENSKIKAAVDEHQATAYAHYAAEIPDIYEYIRTVHELNDELAMMKQEAVAISNELLEPADAVNNDELAMMKQEAVAISNELLERADAVNMDIFDNIKTIISQNEPISQIDFSNTFSFDSLDQEILSNENMFGDFIFEEMQNFPDLPKLNETEIEKIDPFKSLDSCFQELGLEGQIEHLNKLELEGKTLSSSK